MKIEMKCLPLLTDFSLLLETSLSSLTLSTPSVVFIIKSSGKEKKSSTEETELVSMKSEGIGDVSMKGRGDGGGVGKGSRGESS